MNSPQKYSKISTWPQHIPIHNLLTFEKDKNSEHTGRLASSYTL